MKILENKNKWIGLLLFGVLIYLGILIPFKFGFFKDVIRITNKSDLMICVCRHSFELSISFCVILIGAVFWSWYIKNFLVKPYEDVVYLLEKYENKWIFIDRMGKVVILKNAEYISKSFYRVLRTKNYVCEILDKESDGFEIREVKESYWSKFCIIFGSFKTFLILPFLYFVLIQAISMAIIAPFFEKLKYVCLILFICFFLIYDWIYKVKEKIDTINGIIEDDSKKFMMRMWTLGVTLQMMIVFLMTVLFVFLMVTSGNLLTIAFLSFFLFNGLATFLKTLAKLFNNHDIVSSYEKKHEKFVRLLLVFIAFISMVIGIGNENYLFAFGGVVICVMGFLILKHNKKEEEKKHR